MQTLAAARRRQSAPGWGGSPFPFAPSRHPPLLLRVVEGGPIHAMLGFCAGVWCVDGGVMLWGV
eukprot:7150456-Prorocentrum_lima.AAC.1